MKLKRGSPEANLAEAMAAIGRTGSGQILMAHLTDTAMTISAVNAHGLVDQRSTDINEGRRLLAVELLGASNSVKDIEGEDDHG